MLNAIKHRGGVKLRTAQNSPWLLFLDRIFSEQPSDAQTFTRLAEADEAKPSPQARNRLLQQNKRQGSRCVA